MTSSKNLPLIGTYDVVIAGGGTSGVSAAISAARQGKKVLLLENQGFLGGMATGGMISQFMGFADGVTSENVTGVMKDILDQLSAVGAASKIETIYLLHRKDLNVSAAAYDAELLKHILDRLVAEAGVSVMFHTRVIGVEKTASSIESLLIHNTDGVQRVQGKVYIDATFHGNVAVEAGCEWVKGDLNGKLQPGTLMFRLQDVDLAQFNALSYEQKDALARRGIAEGALFTNAILCRPIYSNLNFCNMTRVQLDATIPVELSAGEATGRMQVLKIVDYLRREVPGFQKAALAGAGTYLGLRDSRRIMGKHYLTADEILHSVKFDDSIAISSYPIDIHDPDGGTESTLQRPHNGNYYIPYRCMVGPVENLIFTGRCISTDHEAHAAIRVMATCVQLGEAAGIGAAKSIEQGVSANELDGALVSKAMFA